MVRASSSRFWICALMCGCGPMGGPGVLGEGRFSYCDDECREGIPGATAVGGTFQMAFHSDDLGGEEVTVRSVFPDRLERIEGEFSRFRALRAGTVAVQARAESDDRLVDFVNVVLEDIADLAPFEYPTARTFSLQLSVFNNQICTAGPRGASGDALGGTLDYQWTSSDANIVALESSTDSGCRVLSVVAVGAATITVAVGDLRRTLEVTVVP